ncbi:MAG: NAD-dependent epimerase/dehydratase family protein [Kofleriaceae bacterium]
MNDQPALHVVLGAGQIGARLSEILLARGHRVRQVRRRAPGAARPGLEWATGDITDGAFAEQVGRGAAVIYDCMNPPYHRWPEQLMPVAEGAMRAAASSGARLIVLDNLYMYGAPAGPITEDSPIAPRSKKGELRARLAERRRAAHARGELRLATGRASDFFGPGLPYSVFGDRFFDRIQRGRAGEMFGDVDLPHAYTYADDVARGLEVLGRHDEALGQIYLLPTAPAETTRQLATRLGDALGVPARVKSMPKLVLRGLGVFSPMMRELVEMVYQWEVPFVVDDTRFRTAFGMSATPLAQAAAETASWVRAHAGRAAVHATA